MAVQTLEVKNNIVLYCNIVNAIKTRTLRNNFIYFFSRDYVYLKSTIF